ncbi:MAG: hypothetical protein HUK03_09520, partial [Bacteroidaceae bacterium]|nr:hypothetical protein [Bacteroidaceae bacterium]
MTDSFFEDITQRWFITEPALFATYCTHHLEVNTRMKCPIRTGHGVIEYNPHLIPHSSAAREEYLRSELTRILLKHPYARQPERVRRLAVSMASDMVLSDNVALKWLTVVHPKWLGLEGGNHFEWYAHEVDKCIHTIDVGGLSEEDLDALEEAAEMWEEDEFFATEIDETIRGIKDWGTLPGKAVEQIKASLDYKIDYRRALAGFRTSIISSRRSLTRMRPNRRFAFEAMGSKYDMESHILVAVDVSGSIDEETLKHFFGVISRFFKFGVSTLDVIQFDADIQGEPMHLDKTFHAERSITVNGRGGTNFQPVFHYIKEHKQYD